MEKRDLMFPAWQLPYFVALAEESPETLRERVDVAERAILKRLEELSRTSGREMERFAIREALDSLHTIRRDKLDFPYGTEAALSRFEHNLLNLDPTLGKGRGGS